MGRNPYQQNEEADYYTSQNNQSFQPGNDDRNRQNNLTMNDLRGLSADQLGTGPNRLRVADVLRTPNRFGLTSGGNNNLVIPQSDIRPEQSPERIAAMLQ